MRETFFSHEYLDMIVKEDHEDLQVVDLKDSQRALVWIDGRFEKILSRGVYALWKSLKEVKVLIVDAKTEMFVHDEIETILTNKDAENHFNISIIENGFKGILYRDGKFSRILEAGRYTFWKNSGRVKVFHVDMREKVLDIGGQEIMTKDKVTLRLNTSVTYNVTDARIFTEISPDTEKAIYREAQLALREIIGSVNLDTLLGNKESLSKELKSVTSEKTMNYGIKITGAGIRDIILPGEMKELMNKVIEAEKAAQANLILRREETAAMRSQANTAKLLDNNPTLLRLRELEIVEKIAGNSKLNVVLGEKGLADRVMNLL